MTRRVLLFAVMIGALALSFAGQVAAVAPLLGAPLGVVLALTHDVASLLALHEVVTTTRTAVRRWAWSVLLLAGGTALGLNTWHALDTGLLPEPAAVAVGAGPVVLAWLLSHLVALAGTDEDHDAGSTATSTAAVEPRAVPETTPAPVPEPVEPPAAETGTAGPPPAPGTAGARPPRSDEQCRALLTYPELVPRDPDGFVPVKQAARALGCGPDRARRLLQHAGLLRPAPART